MSFTMDDFDHQYVIDGFLRMTTAERVEVFMSLSPAQRREMLQGLPIEERLAGLTVEQIQQYLDRLTRRRPAAVRRPRRKECRVTLSADRSRRLR